MSMRPIRRWARSVAFDALLALADMFDLLHMPRAAAWGRQKAARVG